MALSSTPPSAYPRRILLIVTGMSPQVVTETLFALATQAEPFIPTEIHLLTTQEGRQRAKTSLLHPDGGQFYALLQDYPQIGQPVFSADNIHVIRAQDAALSDIRTPEENAAAADSITAKVAELTLDADAALHVSIAGGRKTMGFYLGYAFSLFARPQDRLSHVLVSSPFENHPDFYFPPVKPRRLPMPGGAHVDTVQAEITLAEIPVVRLRHGLPQELQDGRASYNETVAAVQSSLAPPHLTLHLATHRVRCGQSEFALPPALTAWLAFWMQSAAQGEPLQSWREANAENFLALYQHVVGEDAVALEKTRKRLANGMEKEFFQENNSKLEKAFKKNLGEFAARPYLLISAGSRGSVRRGLNLPPDAITLVLGREWKDAP
ncbi:CRISPR-associated protein [Betaproteobacteria bacterium]|nr:CRISPR-associated protein [Betaproteobacteria bacterium]GHU40856.1 CRISPR-associated protein [Betaproteobacteria bacterium]